MDYGYLFILIMIQTHDSIVLLVDDKKKKE